MSREYHKPVLLEEAIEALQIDPRGVYVDATFGGGGHAREILQRLTTGRLIAFDMDVDAQQNIEPDPRLTFVNTNFKYMKRFLQYYDAIPVSGILADLGVSSYQIDTPARGFSTRFDAPLDMRMSPALKTTAREIINTYSQEQLIDIFSRYGEVRNARTLAATIVEARQGQPIETVSRFNAAIENVIIGNRNRYLAQVYQALRIVVNDEINNLKCFLQQSLEVLKPGGRLAVIAYHSLEDRLVKRFMMHGSFEPEPMRDIYGEIYRPFRKVTKKPIVPGEAEIRMNPRARSARLRVAEKLDIKLPES